MPNKLTQQEAENKVKEFNQEYELVSEYKNAKSPIRLRHKCGHEYPVGRFKSFFEGTNKRPICYPSQSNVGHSTKKITEKEVIERFA